MKKTSRRRFVTNVAAATAGFAIVPRHVLGRGFTAPSDLLNVAAVGVGGQGRANLINLASENVVALCDVDWDYADKAFAALDTDITSQQDRLDRKTPRLDAQGRPEAPLTATERERMAINIARMKRLRGEHLPRAVRYQDYRQMLEKQKDIDAVIVATPDHMHAAIASAAMSLGKHVYVEKPLCWSVKEARHLAAKARDNAKLVTQMGNQGHSMDEARTGYELITGGAIGEVREVHVWTNRPLGFWPQGVPRPAPAPSDAKLGWNAKGLDARLAAAMASDGGPVPPGLDWDLFLGAGPVIEYHPVYHPFNWRGWVDWGQ